MERLKKIYHRYNMRAMALLLTVVTFLNVPLTSYASISTPSDIDIDSMFSSSDGEYMPDNILSRYEQSFEYCPETVPSPYARIALADDVVMVIVALLAACGIYVGSNSDLVHQIVSGFDTYIRRTAGNVKSVMTAWAAVLSAEAGKTIEGIKVLLPYLRDYLKSFFIGYGTGALEYSYSTGAGALTDGPYSLPGIAFQEKYNTYAFSFSSLYETNMDYDIFWGQPSVPALDNLYVAYLAGGSASKYIQVACIDEDDVFVYNGRPHVGWRRYVPADNAYKYSNGVTRYSTGNINIWESRSSYSLDACIQMVANTISCPLFQDVDYARSFLKYGSMDGLIQPDPDFTVAVPNAWTQLQQDALDRFGNTLTLPSTPEEWEAIKSQLASAATADDALKALSNVMDITSGGGILPPITDAVAYDNLSYVVSTLAGYCGAVLTQGQIDSFIEYYSGVTTGHLDKEALLENANIIVHNSIVINGGSTDPDDDKRNNNYKVLKKLAVSLGAFLIGLGLVSDSPNFDDNPTINNVQVVGDLPNPSPNPNPNPDMGVDLSGVLNFLQSILNVLNTWANPLALMDSLVSKLGLPTISDGIKAAINALPKLIIGELTLPELFGNVTDAIFSLPQQVADAIAKALGLEKALESLGLKKLFDNVIELLPDALVEGFALPSLFDELSSIIITVPKTISNLFGIVDDFSLSEVLNDIFESVQSLPQKIKDIIPPPPSIDSNVEDSDDDGFRKFVIALIALLLILVLLFILFLNLLMFIVSIFSIPASTALLNEDVISGLEFLKTVELPMFSLSIYDLIMGCVYFVVFMSIIAMIRKQINHIRVKG